MILFDASQLSVDIVRLKSATTAFGGSITILDEEATLENGRESFERMDVPMAVVRAFIKANKNVSKYLKPVYTAVVKYGDKVVCLERHPLASLAQLETEGLNGPQRWIPSSERLLQSVVLPQIVAGDYDWYFDGRYVYRFDNNDMNVVIRGGEYLSQNGQFRKLIVRSMDLQALSSLKQDFSADERTCLAFVASNGTFAVSPPIWKDVSKIGASQFKKASASVIVDEDDDEEVGEVSVSETSNYTFDRIDNELSVNLNFSLAAGNAIGGLFGYEAIEPLQLPRLMIHLRTVNLPNVSKANKALFDVGMDFTVVLAWLLGLTRKANTLDTYLVMRSLMKYLTTKGIFRADVHQASNVYKRGKTAADVQVKSLSELLDGETYGKSLAEMIEDIQHAQRKRKRDKVIGSVVGGTFANDEEA